MLTLAIWWLLATTALQTVIPTPIAVIQKLADNGIEFYLSNASATVSSAAIGYLVGTLAAIALAILAAVWPWMESAATRLAMITYCLPVVAIGPVVVVIFGGRAPSVFLAALSVFFTTVSGTQMGLASADRSAMDVVRAAGGGRWRQLRLVKIIAAIPGIFAALRIAVPAAFLGAVLGEYLGGVDSGLGVVMTAAQSQSDITGTWALALVSGVIAGLGYAAVGWLGKRVTPWTSSDYKMTMVEIGQPIDRGLVPATIKLVANFVLTLLLFLAVWWAILLVYRIDPLIGRTPLDVLQFLTVEEDRNYVAANIAITLQDTVPGFVVGLVAALAVSFGFVWSKAVEGALMPLALLLRSVPLVAMAPVILLIFEQ